MTSLRMLFVEGKRIVKDGGNTAWLVATSCCPTRKDDCEAVRERTRTWASCRTKVRSTSRLTGSWRSRVSLHVTVFQVIIGLMKFCGCWNVLV